MDNTRSEKPQYRWWIAGAVALGVLLYLLAPILAPFLFAAILAYICNPLVDRMSRRSVPRTLAAALMLAILIALFVAFMLVMVPLLVRQARAMAQQIPVYLDWFRTTVAPWLSKQFGMQLDVEFVKEWVTEHLADIQHFAVKMLPSITTGGMALVDFVVNFVLVLVVLFYFMRDWNRLMLSISEMVPRRWYAQFVALFTEINEVLGQFLRGQLFVMLLMGAFYTIALWLVGLDYALSVGMIAGLVTFVPYLGVITGVALATLTGLLQFDNMSQLVWVWGVFVLGNVLEGYVFVPMLVGERIGLHPVAVIFALLAFGQLFGFFGVLLAVPVSASLLVWLRHLRRGYLGSGMYNA
ncbi:MAG: AI-2E family transporter [Rhodospirillaceae bacterium]